MTRWPLPAFLVLLVVAGCTEERLPQDVAPAQKPIVAQKQAVPTHTPPPVYDSLGRLIPGELRIDGFPLPRLTREITAEGAPTRSFEMRALRKPVLEFYSHRDFHVIEMRRGYKIQHSSNTRERNGKDKEGLGSLVLFERSQRNLMVRYLPPPAIPKAKASSKADKAEPTPEGQEAQEQALESDTPVRKARAKEVPKRSPRRSLCRLIRNSTFDGEDQHK